MPGYLPSQWKGNQSFQFPSYQEWKTQFQSSMPTWPKANFSEDFLAGLYRDAQRRGQMVYDTANPKPSFAPLNLPDPTKYFGEQGIQKLFDVLFGNLSRAKGSAVSSAVNTAGAYAGQRGLANPGAFITASGTGAAAPYAQAFGGLEGARGQALTENQRLLWQALMGKSQFEEQARQFNVSDERQRQGLQQQYDLGLQGLRLQKQQSEANIFDWGDLAAKLAMAITYAACWIAEAIYGQADERTHFARYAVNYIWPRTRMGRVARALYMKYGKQIAGKINKHPSLKIVFRPLFELMWRSGRRELEKIYAGLSEIYG